MNYDNLWNPFRDIPAGTVSSNGILAPRFPHTPNSRGPMKQRPAFSQIAPSHNRYFGTQGTVHEGNWRVNHPYRAEPWRARTPSQNFSAPRFHRAPAQFGVWQPHPHFSPYHAPAGNRSTYNQPLRSPRNVIYCDVCEQEFRNKAKYDEHVGKHAKCPKCEFVGVFETIEVHFELVHLSAMMNKAKPEETPEDLKRWREERARRYPRPRKSGTKNIIPSGTRLESPPGDSAELSDGEIVESEMEETKPKSGINGLASLCTYLDSESDSEPEEIPMKIDRAPQAVVPLENVGTQTPVDRKETCALSKTPIITRESRIVRKKTTASEFLSPAGVPTRNPRTLYERLVLKDIETENDLLLQCVAQLYKKRREPGAISSTG